MKAHYVIVGLLILLGMSTYADDERVVGFTEPGCTGNWLMVSNFNALYDYHDDWEFESYLYLSDTDTCYPFEEPVTATGTVPTTTGGSNGGGSSGGGGGRNGGNSNAPSVGGTTAEQSATQDEINENLKDCWVNKLKDDATITSWVGTKTEATWISKPKAHWQMSTLEYDSLGVVTRNNGNLTAILFTSEIASLAAARGVKQQHMHMMAQMHEHTHLLQWIHYANTHDGADPPPYLYFDMEVEAHNRSAELYRAFTGSSPPYLTDANSRSLPGGFKKKRKRYKELEEKVANGEELIVDEKEGIDEPGEMKNLKEWFEAPENLPGILEGENGFYDENVDLECDEDEDASE